MLPSSTFPSIEGSMQVGAIACFPPVLFPYFSITPLFSFSFFIFLFWFLFSDGDRIVAGGVLLSLCKKALQSAFKAPS